MHELPHSEVRSDNSALDSEVRLKDHHCQELEPFLLGMSEFYSLLNSAVKRQLASFDLDSTTMRGKYVKSFCDPVWETLTAHRFSHQYLRVIGGVPDTLLLEALAQRGELQHQLTPRGGNLHDVSSIGSSFPRN